MKYLPLIFMTLCVSSCSTGQGMILRPFEEFFKQDTITPHNFQLCHAHNCSQKTQVSLRPLQWRSIQGIFAQKPETAEEERALIAQAIAHIELSVDRVTRLHPDEAGSTALDIDESQMDSVDEARNTSLYLQFLQDDNLLHFHERIDPLHRARVLKIVLPHNSAAIKDIETGQVYAVDSYFTDSGDTVSIVPVQEWVKNWRPAK